MKLNRILVIGISGTGKTTFARKLSKILELPIVHYDQFVWDKDWTEINEKIVEKKIEDAVKKDKWIIEGYILPAAEIRLKKADIVLYLDYSGFCAMLGGLKRWWQHRGKTRIEMAEGCIEKLDVKYLKIMLTREERPEIEDAIKSFDKKVIRLKTRKEATKFLEKISHSKI